MKNISFIVIGVLASLLLSSVFIPVVSAADNKNKVIIPEEWHGKDKIVIPHDNLVEVIYIHYAASKANAEAAQHQKASYNGYDTLGWRWPSKGVSYVIDPTFMTTQGLSPAAVEGAIQNSFGAWNGAVPGLWTYGGISTAKYSLLDEINVVTWGNIDDPNVIAVTHMWISYPIKDTLIDADILFNTMYTWGIDPDGEGPTPLTDAMFDIQDICTHEAGHALGLADLYATNYLPLTMYGYGYHGEINKISLERGDSHGAQKVHRQVN